MTFSAPSDSLDPIAEDALGRAYATTAGDVRRSGGSLYEVSGGGRHGGTSSIHSSPGRKSLGNGGAGGGAGGGGPGDDASELGSLAPDHDTLFLAPEWLEIPLEMYSDFKSASSLAHKLLTESLMKTKIRQWRKDAYAKALSCLWAAAGFYHHYYTADLVGCDEPLKA
eukprot:gene22927-17325_t